MVKYSEAEKVARAYFKASVFSKAEVFLRLRGCKDEFYHIK
jgi:hypothetical protein